MAGSEKAPCVQTGEFPRFSGKHTRACAARLLLWHSHALCMALRPADLCALAAFLPGSTTSIANNPMLTGMAPNFLAPRVRRLLLPAGQADRTHHVRARQLTDFNFNGLSVRWSLAPASTAARQVSLTAAHVRRGPLPGFVVAPHMDSFEAVGTRMVAETMNSRKECARRLGCPVPARPGSTAETSDGPPHADLPEYLRFASDLSRSGTDGTYDYTLMPETCARPLRSMGAPAGREALLPRAPPMHSMCALALPAGPEGLPCRPHAGPTWCACESWRPTLSTCQP